jgi:hypothetical protein
MREQALLRAGEGGEGWEPVRRSGSTFVSFACFVVVLGARFDGGTAVSRSGGGRPPSAPTTEGGQADFGTFGLRQCTAALLGGRSSLRLGARRDRSPAVHNKSVRSVPSVVNF